MKKLSLYLITALFLLTTSAFAAEPVKTAPVAPAKQEVKAEKKAEKKATKKAKKSNKKAKKSTKKAEKKAAPKATPAPEAKK
jgi:hypothetical protein